MEKMECWVEHRMVVLTLLGLVLATGATIATCIWHLSRNSYTEV